jgi:hypothetical protein
MACIMQERSAAPRTVSENIRTSSEAEHPSKRMVERMKAIDRLLQHARKLQVPRSTSDQIVAA